MRIYSFALGGIWKWTKSNNIGDLVGYAKKLDISGVEVTFASKEEVYAFNLSINNKSWLKSLDYVTIHAPFDFIQKSEDDIDIIKQLEVISELYDEVDAKNVIIHPDALPAQEILENYDFNISTENLPKKKHKRHVSIHDLEKILQRYPEMGLCLDVSHAYRCSKFETEKLVKRFKNRISQIHLSGTYRGKDHKSLREVTNNFLLSIEPIKELDVPIVIEENIEIKNIRYIQNEIDYIKKILDGK